MNYRYAHVYRNANIEMYIFSSSGFNLILGGGGGSPMEMALPNLILSLVSSFMVAIVHFSQLQSGHTSFQEDVMR